MLPELPNISPDWMNNLFLVSANNFEALALQVYQHQYIHNGLYAQYANSVGRTPLQVKTLTDIPFLPISFFKTHPVVTGHFEAAAVFESSGTTQTIASKHYVKDLEVYEQSFKKAFEQFYGAPHQYCIIALLPSYVERQNSSLVFMANQLMKQSNHPDTGFYLYEYEKLQQVLQKLEAAQTPCLLLGVTFALLDFAEQYPLSLKHTTVMETGGMKGRREEWTRHQVHQVLRDALGLGAIHAEYGMTELLSQAYSAGDGIFKTPPWMKILVRQEDDPFSIATNGNGVINVIDLANIYSCSFIATDDAAKLYANGSFEILGRMDNTDIRGCSLMVV
jgi:hypothetical protein